MTFAAEAGQLQLNAFEPVIAYNLLQSMRIMTRAMATLTERCIRGITANADHCRRQVEMSIGLVTALCPVVGYERATRIAQMAQASGRGILELAIEEGLLDRDALASLLSPETLAHPHQATRNNPACEEG